MVKKRVLITGIGGFIGSNLAELLGDQGYEVWGIGKSKRTDKNYFQVDLTCKNHLSKIANQMPHFSIIIHIAAAAHGEKLEGNKSVLSYNVEMTKNIIQCFSKKKTSLIFFSSVAVYGEDQRYGYVDELCDLRPYSNYGLSKKVCEELFLKSKFNNCIILRLCPVYNENNLKDVRKRVFFPIFGTFKLKMIPSPKYSFTHIDTVKKVIIRFIKNPQNGKSIYNISDKSLYCQNKLLDWFLDILFHYQ